MKRIALSVLAAATVVAAIPAAASAQPSARHYDNGPGRHQERPWQTINQRQAELDRRIDIGVRTGRISRREAQNLRYQLEEYQRVEWRYRRDGLSNWERRDLQGRLDRIERNLREERRDRDGRW